MEKTHNLVLIAEELKDQFEGIEAGQMMQKCTKACFLSMKENKLLPTEDRCLTNCFIKSGNFNTYFEKELSYVMRNMKSLNEQ